MDEIGLDAFIYAIGVFGGMHLMRVYHRNGIDTYGVVDSIAAFGLFIAFEMIIGMF